MNTQREEENGKIEIVNLDDRCHGSRIVERLHFNGLERIQFAKIITWKNILIATYICKWCEPESTTLSNDPWSDVVDRIDGELDVLGLGGGVTEPPSEWNPSSTWSVSIVTDDRLQVLSGTFNVSPF